MILFGTDERVEKPRVLNEKQVVQMAENLLLLMLQTDDTVSRLFAKDLSNVIAEMLKLGTDTDPAAAAEICRGILLLIDSRPEWGLLF